MPGLATESGSFVPDMSKETDQTEKRLRDCLSRRIVDKEVGFEGKAEHRKQIGRDILVGAIEAKVSRCDPKLEVPNLRLASGKSVAIFGPNGAGKTTLLDAIMDRDNARFDIGSCGYNAGVHGKESLRIGRLDQEEIFDVIDEMQVDKVIEQVTAHHKNDFPADYDVIDWDADDADDRLNECVTNQEAQTRIDEITGKFEQLFEICHFKKRKVKELSGGERTKLSLLMLLSGEPDVLLLDEPTNHLDIESIAKLMGLFDSYKRAGVSVVNVSHVEWFLDMVGQDGVHELQTDEKKRKVVSSKAPYKNFMKREQRQPLLRDPITWDQNYDYKFVGGGLFEVPRKITVKESPLIDVEMPTIAGSAITVLSGKNGTGKTKLMEDMVDRHSKNFRREKGMQVAHLPQMWPEEIMHQSADLFFLWIKEQINPDSYIDTNRFVKELRNLGFSRASSKQLTRQPLSTFSGGEQRLMWFVAASLLEGTDCLVLDEPTNHMDKATMGLVVKAIRDFPGAVVLSTHDLRLMEELEVDPGKTRQGRGVTNVALTRIKDRTTAEEIKMSPRKYAEEVMEQAKKQGGRVNVGL